MKYCQGWCLTCCQLWRRRREAFPGMVVFIDGAMTKIDLDLNADTLHFYTKCY